MLALALLATVAGHFYAVQSDKLASTEERYRLLFERSFCAIYRCNADGSIIDCNPAFLRLVGYDHLADLIGQPLASILTDEARRDYLEPLHRSGSMGILRDPDSPP